MNITKNNYEAYFLDYHEGNLSTQEVADLLLFLSQHPELKTAFEDFENIKLEDADAPVFQNKDRLKKNITADNCDHYFIGAIEGTLDPVELDLLTAFLKDQPAFLTTFNAFKKTKLTADPTLVFNDKERLKKAGISADHFIAAVEGLLTEEEQLVFEKQLLADKTLQKTYKQYQQTKFIADTSIFFSNKQALKRKEKKIIPLFYYVAAAASIALLIGLMMIIFKSTNVKEQQLAGHAHPEQSHEQVPLTRRDTILETSGQQRQPLANGSSLKNLPLASTKKLQKKNSKRSEINHSVHELADTTMTSENLMATHSVSSVKNTLPVDSIPSGKHTTSVPAVAIIEKKTPLVSSPGFTSLRDVLTIKLKEKLVDKDVLEAERKTTTTPRISGWDIAGALAKGISKATGKKVCVKPKFNEQGDLTAYAFSAGKLEFSKGK